MKIKVTPEGRDEMFLISKDQAKLIIENYPDDKIHNFIKSGFSVWGTNWKKENVIKAIDQSERMALMIGQKYIMQRKHALSVIINNQLNMFDVGEIKRDQLEVQ